MTLFLWLMFLFGFIGVAASDFFCPNLNTIASKLNLSESMAGVTFLAFGNGSPDVFSTFSAMTHGSGSLAIGELIGAASFITSVVAGSMAVISPFLVVGTWYVRDQKKKQWQEQRAREEYDDSIVFGENQDAYGYDTYNENDLLLPDVEHRSGADIIINGNSSRGRRTSFSNNNRDFQLQEQYSPSSFISFRDVVKSLKLDSNVNTLGLFGHNNSNNYYRQHHQRHPERLDNRSSNPERKNWSNIGREERALETIGGSTGRRHNVGNNDIHDAPKINIQTPKIPSTTDEDFFASGSTSSKFNNNSNNSGEIGSSNLNVPSLLVIPPTPNQGPVVVSNMSPSLNSSTIDLLPKTHQEEENNDDFTPVPPLVLESSSLPKMSPFTCLRSSFWTKARATLFPSLTGFSQKSYFTKLTALMAMPAIFLLTLTLPVVEAKENEVGWNKWLTAIQFLCAPIFISSVLFAGDKSSVIIVLYAFIFGLLASIFCILFTSEFRTPRFHSLLCFMGFGVAIVWIFLVANEVVGLLQALGQIMGLSDAILGLTIFAMGNSLGDFVANITIAKMGFPMMAMSACFGGPMLNILLGVGISATYVAIKTGSPSKIEVEATLFISSIGLLLGLCSVMIYLPYNGYRMTKALGYYLISIYVICMLINVVLEVKSINSS
ncbi:18033_t:CDS:10 [Entrophospora sp. SA101]|nr:11687_t:CDS:10 [Entrophospora sp. SA101]CAJ0910346.1 18033_t:CDS:10 [Entrophospora sp. SA101]